MNAPPQETVSQLLEALRDGNSEAINALFPLVYDELHSLAHRKRIEWRGDYTMNTTALVHEAYLKLVDQTRVKWNSRSHFFAVASKAMRHLLINYAEAQRAQKRGGNVVKVSLDEQVAIWKDLPDLADNTASSLIELNKALKNLEAISERQARIVECRFFGGMTIEETAEALDVSPATVKRGWAMAQAWLHRAIQESKQ